MVLFASASALTKVTWAPDLFDVLEGQWFPRRGASCPVPLSHSNDRPAEASCVTWREPKPHSIRIPSQRLFTEKNQSNLETQVASSDSLPQAKIEKGEMLLQHQLLRRRMTGICLVQTCLIVQFRHHGFCWEHIKSPRTPSEIEGVKHTSFRLSFRAPSPLNRRCTYSVDFMNFPISFNLN